MIELLQQYSAQNIIIFIVLFSLAVKGCVTFYDWVVTRAKQAFEKNQEPEELKNNLEQHSEEIKQLKEMLVQLDGMVKMLIKSDRDDIKAYITREHHYYVYEQKWIDDYTLDCIERRYVHYAEEGGNSFIKTLMGELRRLPKTAPTDSEG